MTETELRNSVVTAMKSWLGAVKGDGTHKAIIDTYNTISPLPRGIKMAYDWPWCAAAVSAAFQKAGLVDLIPAECSCGLMLKAAQERGIWVEDDNYRPKPGDLVFYDWQDDGNGDNRGTPDHVGVVVEITADGFSALEGNAGGKSRVNWRVMSYNSRYIRGFITPDYTSKAGREVTAISTFYASASQTVYTWEKLDCLRPYLTVTAKYSDGTDAVVSEYDLSGDLSVVGPRTITVSYGGQTDTFMVDVEGIVESTPIAPWYTEAMTWAKDMGLMDGTRPEDPMTRADVATVLYRLCKALKEV